MVDMVYNKVSNVTVMLPIILDFLNATALHT